MKSLLFGIHRVSGSKIRHLNSFGIYTINRVQWVLQVKFQASLSVKQIILVVHPRSDFSSYSHNCKWGFRDISGEAPRKPGTSMIIIFMHFSNVGSFFNVAFKALVLYCIISGC